MHYHGWSSKNQWWRMVASGSVDLPLSYDSGSQLGVQTWLPHDFMRRFKPLYGARQTCHSIAMLAFQNGSMTLGNKLKQYFQVCICFMASWILWIFIFHNKTQWILGDPWQLTVPPESGRAEVPDVRLADGRTPARIGSTESQRWIFIVRSWWNKPWAWEQPKLRNILLWIISNRGIPKNRLNRPQTGDAGGFWIPQLLSKNHGIQYAIRHCETHSLIDHAGISSRKSLNDPADLYYCDTSHQGLSRATPNQ